MSITIDCFQAVPYHPQLFWTLLYPTWYDLTFILNQTLHCRLKPMNTRMCIYLNWILDYCQMGPGRFYLIKKDLCTYKSQNYCEKNIPLHILLGYFKQCSLDCVIYFFKDNPTESHSYEYWFWVGSSNSCEFSPSSAFDCDRYKNYTL